MLAVAEDRDAVGEVGDLAPPVRGEDHALPALAEPAHQREQPLHLLLGERGGRLIEEEDVRVAEERARDLDDLAVRERERRGKLVRVDSLDPEPREDLVGASGELAPVDQTRAPLRLVVEEEVLRDAHLPDQCQLLVEWILQRDLLHQEHHEE